MKKIDEKIVLTEGEIEAIKMQLEGKIEIWTTDEEIQKNLGSVIDKAEALEAKYDLYDESGDDLIQWFYDRYKAQDD